MQPLPEEYLALHPFGRIPVLMHEAFVLHETRAITHYIDAEFDGVALVSDKPVARARMEQVISVIDNYLYWPMIRQVFAHQVFRPLADVAPQSEVIAEGIRDTGPVLDVLEGIAGDGVLTGDRLTLADCHLAPMIAYFAETQVGPQMLSERPKLACWWEWVRDRDSLSAAGPSLGAFSVP